MFAQASGVQGHVEVVAVHDPNPWHLPSMSQTLGHVAHGIEGVADDDIGAPRTKLTLDPSRLSPHASSSQTRIGVVGQGKKTRNEYRLVPVLPATRCLRHPLHGRASCFGVGWHSGQRVDDPNFVAELAKELNVIVNKHTSASVRRNGMQQTHDEDLDGEPSIIEVPCESQRGCQPRWPGR